MTQTVAGGAEVNRLCILSGLFSNHCTCLTKQVAQILEQPKFYTSISLDFQFIRYMQKAPLAASEALGLVWSGRIGMCEKHLSSAGQRSAEL